MYEANVEGHLVVCEWVVGVDGMFHAFLSLRRQVLCGSENQNYRRFFWLSWTSPAAEPKNGVFFDMAHPPPSFFFPPAAWHLPKVTDPSKC